MSHPNFKFSRTILRCLCLALLLFIAGNCRFYQQLADEVVLESSAGFVSRGSWDYLTAIYKDRFSAGMLEQEWKKRLGHLLWAREKNASEHPAWKGFLQLQQRERMDLALQHCLKEANLAGTELATLAKRMNIGFVPLNKAFEVIHKTADDQLGHFMGSVDGEEISGRDAKSLYASSEWQAARHTPLAGFNPVWREIRRRILAQACDANLREKFNARDWQINLFDEGEVAWLYLQVLHHKADKGVFPVDGMKLATSAEQRMRYFEKFIEQLTPIDEVTYYQLDFKTRAAAMKYMQKLAADNADIQADAKGKLQKIRPIKDQDNATPLQMLVLSNAREGTSGAWVANPVAGSRWFVVEIASVKRSNKRPQYKDYQGFAEDELNALLARKTWETQWTLWQRKLEWKSNLSQADNQLP